MTRSTTLSASGAVRNVEAYLAAQYAKRKRVEKRQPADGVVVIIAWCLIAWILIGE